MKTPKRDIIREVLRELYPDFKNDNFYLIPDAKEEDVRTAIVEKLNEKGIRNNNSSLDLYIFTSQISEDVLIKDL